MQSAEQRVGLYNLTDFMKTRPEPGTIGASAIIGPEGGVVAVTDPASPVYGTSLRIPAGALETPVTISIRGAKHSCTFGMGPAIELFPGGLHFKRSATLTIYLNESGEDEDDFEGDVPACYHYDESRDRWTHNSSIRLERLGNAVLCELHHL